MNQVSRTPQQMRRRVLEMREKYAKPTHWKSVWQLVNTVPPHLALTYAIYLNWSGPLWITIPLLLVNSFFLNRIFVLFHDVMHGSFFRSRRVGDWVGTLLGLLIYHPAHHWQYEHAHHHSNSNDLSRRHIGDMPVLTVREYARLSPLRRGMYRILRNPLFLFSIHAIYKLMIKPRWVAKKDWPFRVYFSVHFTNFAIVAIGLTMWYFGLGLLFAVHALSFAISTASQLMLFYVNHHFESSQWYAHEDWDFFNAALKGTSIITYPPIINWFSAGIGMHAQHHLLPKTPNYNLRACWLENPDVFGDVFVVPFFETPKTYRLRIWDEDSGRYLGREGYKLAEKIAREENGTSVANQPVGSNPVGVTPAR